MGQRQTKRQKEIVDRENETKADKEIEGDRRNRKNETKADKETLKARRQRK